MLLSKFQILRFGKCYVPDIMKQSHHNKLTVTRIVKKFYHFYGTFTTVHHLSLSCARLIQSTFSHQISLKSILILTSHLHIRLPRCPFPSGFPTKTLHAFLFSPMRTICPAHLIVLDFITQIIISEQYKLCSAS